MPRHLAPAFETMGDLLEWLGGIAPRRVRLRPLPGKATERDLQSLLVHTDRLFELIDGIVVEKVCDFRDAMLTSDLVFLLGRYLDGNDLGALAGPDGTMRLRTGLVLAPDISFVRWEQMPSRLIPLEPFPPLFPDLAVEVLSEGNTTGEMALRRGEYFRAGTRLVWFVRREGRTVEVFTAPDQSQLFTEDDTLDGGDVLPGLRLPVKDIFAKMPRAKTPEAKRPRRRKLKP